MFVIEKHVPDSSYMFAHLVGSLDDARAYIQALAQGYGQDYREYPRLDGGVNVYCGGTAAKWTSQYIVHPVEVMTREALLAEVAKHLAQIESAKRPA